MSNFSVFIEESIEDLESCLQPDADPKEVEDIKERIEWYKDFGRATQDLFDEAHMCAEELISLDKNVRPDNFDDKIERLAPVHTSLSILLAEAYKLGYLKALRDTPENISKNKR